MLFVIAKTCSNFSSAVIRYWFFSESFISHRFTGFKSKTYSKIMFNDNVGSCVFLPKDTLKAFDDFKKQAKKCVK